MLTLSNLESVYTFLGSIRQSGATTAVVEVVRKSPTSALLVTRNEQEANRVRREFNIPARSIIGLEGIANGFVQGRKPWPLVIDPFAVVGLLQSCLKECHRLEKELSECRKRLATLEAHTEGTSDE